MAYSYYNPYAQPMQPMQAAPQYQQATPQTQNNQGLIWVSGEIGAKSYLMTPNSTVMLMDSEAQKFYIKTTDNAGMPTLRSYEYKECLQNAPQATNSDFSRLNEQFTTKEEYNVLFSKYTELKACVDDLTRKKTSKKEVTADE